MSSYFSGVTFAQQHFAPADDAIARRSVLPDCRLKGCGFTYSGFRLTMDAGYLMACGRQIRHPFDQAWTLTRSTGFARLLLTVEVRWSQGRELSHDITSAVEYADTLTAFHPLKQHDICTNGWTYQMPLCVVSLGSSGITRIIEELNGMEVS